MAIAINGSGTITGISVGGIPDGTVDTDVLAANAVTYAKIGTTEQGQLCKAWVNFNGTGTVSIRASYNVSSITDSGVGLYRANFTTSMSDTNYCGVGSAGDNGSYGDRQVSIYALNTAYATVNTGLTASTTLYDSNYVNVAIFR